MKTRIIKDQKEFDTIDSIKELRKGLFTWHELTGEPVNKPDCH